MLCDYYGMDSRNIFLCNFDCEDFWPEQDLIRLPALDLQKIKPLVQNLDELFIFLARKEDVLVLRNKPDNEFIEYLKNLGVEVPFIMTIYSDNEKKTISELILEDKDLIGRLKEYVTNNSNEKISTNLIPYGISKSEEALAECLSVKVLSESKISSFLNCKSTLITLSAECGVILPESLVCEGIDELKNEGRSFCESNGKIVLKELFGSSGSGLVKIDSLTKYDRLINNIERLSNLKGKIIIEKWHDSCLSYNHQYIMMGKDIFPYAFSRQIINSSSGKIIGSLFDQELDYIENLRENHLELGKPILDAISKKGYQGLAGFDSIVRNGNVLFPVIDINCRINLSSIFYEISKKYFPSKFAYFFCKEYMLSEPITFASFRKIIDKVAYSPSKAEGIVVLNFTALNLNYLRSKSKIGRVFFALFAENKKRASEICKKSFLNEDDEIYIGAFNV
ncbi:MAG: hypothetical protein FWG91_01250 [Lachnospiraceae bacterium]|nr:hypothetical protein [Lachnospiraceae bacterium]